MAQTDFLLQIGQGIHRMAGIIYKINIYPPQKMKLDLLKKVSMERIRHLVVGTELEIPGKKMNSLNNKILKQDDPLHLYTMQE